MADASGALPGSGTCIDGMGPSFSGEISNAPSEVTELLTSCANSTQVESAYLL